MSIRKVSVLCFFMCFCLLFAAGAEPILFKDIVGEWGSVKWEPVIISKQSTTNNPLHNEEMNVRLVFGNDYYGITETYYRRRFFNKLIGSIPFTYILSSNVLTIADIVVCGNMSPNVFTNELYFIRSEHKYVVSLNQGLLTLTPIEHRFEREIDGKIEIFFGPIRNAHVYKRRWQWFKKRGKEPF